MPAVNNSHVVRTQTVRINTVAHVDTLNVIDGNKTLWNRFVEGASWSAGATTATYVVYKVCDIAFNTFFGVKTGAEAGAIFGPNGAFLGAVAGGATGAIKGIFA